MKRNFTILGAVTLLGMVASPSFATSLSIATDNSTPQAVLHYGNIYTSGDDMDGMQVVVTYADATKSTYTWATTTSPGGGVSGGGFSLSFPGTDTYFTPWTLTNSGKAISDIKLDGFPGLTLFDKEIPGGNGTANSPGKTFSSLTGGTGYDLAVTYSGPISVDGSPLIGPPVDVYRWLDINFAQPFTGPALTFIADTDNFGSVVDPSVPGVPEPAPMMIMGLGVLMMGGLIARKRLSLKA